MESENKNKRGASSILKPQKPRKPLCEVDKTKEITTTSKRVSFRRHSSVKPFMFDSEQQNTIWDVTYEEPVSSVHSLDSSSSAKDNSEVSSKEVNLIKNLEIEETVKIKTVRKSSVKFSEHEETKFFDETMNITGIDPIRSDTTDITVFEESMDITRVNEKVTITATKIKEKIVAFEQPENATVCAPQEMDLTIVDQSLRNENFNFINKCNSGEIRKRQSSITNESKNLNQSKTEFRNVTTTSKMDITCGNTFEHSIYEKVNSPDNIKTDDGNTNCDMELTCHVPLNIANITVENFKSNCETSCREMDFTCPVSEDTLFLQQKLGETIGMELTRQIPENLDKLKKLDSFNTNAENSSLAVCHKRNELNLNETSACDMEFTCQIPSKIISNNQPVLNTEALSESHCNIGNEQFINPALNDTSACDMEFTCQIPSKIKPNLQTYQNSEVSNRSVCNNENVQFINETLNKTSACDMEFTCQIPSKIISNNQPVLNTEALSEADCNIGHDQFINPALNDTSVCDMEFTCQIPSKIKPNLQTYQNTEVSNRSVCNNENVHFVNETLNKTSACDMEFTCQIPSKIISNNQPALNSEALSEADCNIGNDTSACDMEFTCQIPSKIKPNLQTFLNTEVSNRSVHNNENIHFVKETLNETSACDMEFTCQIPSKIKSNIQPVFNTEAVSKAVFNVENEHFINPTLNKTSACDMEFTCQFPSKNKSNFQTLQDTTTTNQSICNKIPSETKLNWQTKKVFNESVSRKVNETLINTNLNETNPVDMEFTCQFPSKIAPQKELEILQSPGSIQNKSLKETTNFDMEFTCQFPPVAQLVKNVQGIEKLDKEFDHKLKHTLQKESTYFNMEVSSIVNNTNKKNDPNVSHNWQNKHSNLDMEVACKAPFIVSDINKENDPNLIHKLQKESAYFDMEVSSIVKNTNKENDPNVTHNLQNERSNLDMEVACKSPFIVSDINKENDPNPIHKLQKEAVYFDMEVSSIVNNTNKENDPKVTHNLQNERSNLDMEVACKAPFIVSDINKENDPNLIHKLQKESAYFDMEVSSIVKNTNKENDPNVTHNLQNERSNLDMEVACKVPFIVSDINKENDPNLIHKLQKEAVYFDMEVSSIVNNTNKENDPNVTHNLQNERSNLDMEVACKAPFIVSDINKENDPNLIHKLQKESAYFDMEVSSIVNNTNKENDPNVTHNLQNERSNLDMEVACKAPFIVSDINKENDPNLIHKLQKESPYFDMEVSSIVNNTNKETDPKVTHNLQNEHSSLVSEVTCKTPVIVTDINKENNPNFATPQLVHNEDGQKPLSCENSSILAANQDPKKIGLNNIDKENNPNIILQNFTHRNNENFSDSILNTKADMDICGQIKQLQTENTNLQKVGILDSTTGEEFKCQKPLKIVAKPKNTKKCMASIDKTLAKECQLQLKPQNQFLFQNCLEDNNSTENPAKVELNKSNKNVDPKEQHEEVENLQNCSKMTLQTTFTEPQESFTKLNNHVGKNITVSNLPNDDHNQMKENISCLKAGELLQPCLSEVVSNSQTKATSSKHISDKLKNMSVNYDSVYEIQGPLKTLGKQIYNTPESSFNNNLTNVSPCIDNTQQLLQCTFANQESLINSRIDYKESRIENENLPIIIIDDTQLTLPILNSTTTYLEEIDAVRGQIHLQETYVDDASTLEDISNKNGQSLYRTFTKQKSPLHKTYVVDHVSTLEDINNKNSQSLYKTFTTQESSLHKTYVVDVPTREDINQKNISQESDVLVENLSISSNEGSVQEEATINQQKIDLILSKLKTSKWNYVPKLDIEKIDEDSEKTDEKIRASFKNLDNIFDRLIKQVNLKVSKIKEFQNSVHLLTEDTEITSEIVEENVNISEEQVLVEKIRTAESRANKMWTFEKQSGDLYHFHTFHGTVVFVVKCTTDPCLVSNVNVTTKLSDQAINLIKYMVKLCQESLSEEALSSALGGRYDILSLLDYIYSVVVKLLRFSIDFEELEYSNALELTDNNRFKFKIRIASLCIWWNIEVDGKDLKNILPDQIIIDIIHGKCDINAVKNLVYNCPRTLGFLKSYVEEINQYLKRFVKSC